MPPKKKSSGKKSSKVKSAALIDGLTKDELSKEQMIEHIAILREQLDREREERNYFQLERDKIHSFWDVTKKQLKEAVAQLRNEEKKIEEDEGRHLVEIKVYKQKIKHLLCEHHNTISELESDRVTTAEVREKEQAQLERELHKKTAAIRNDIHQLDIENLVSELEKRHNGEVAKTKKNWEDQLAGRDITLTVDPDLEYMSFILSHQVQRCSFTKHDSTMLRGPGRGQLEPVPGDSGQKVDYTLDS